MAFKFVREILENRQVPGRTNWSASSKRLILLVFASHANKDTHLVFLTSRRIAFETGLGKRTVETYIPELEEDGVLKWTGKYRKGGTKVYRLDPTVYPKKEMELPQLPAEAEENKISETRQLAQMSAPSYRNPLRPATANVDGRTSMNPYVNPKASEEENTPDVLQTEVLEEVEEQAASGENSSEETLVERPARKFPEMSNEEKRAYLEEVTARLRAKREARL